MTAESWSDVLRMCGCLAVTAAGAAPLLLVRGTVATAARCWAVVTPAVLLIHATVNAVTLALGEEVQEHPLATHTPHPVVLIAQACVFAPLVEELIFRGVLLRVLQLVGEVATWLALAAGVGVAMYYGGTGPGVFAGLVALGWVGARFRSADHAVYGSSALFAAVHSAVWPTPIPLFALGLGLGWVAVRTKGIFAPFLVHGLFNAVSVLYVLSGAAR